MKYFRLSLLLLIIAVTSSLQSCDKDEDTTPELYYSEIEALDSTTLNTLELELHTSLELPPGKYILTGYLEAFNTSHEAGVRAGMYGDSTEIAYGIVYSNTSTFGSWSAVKEVNSVMTTTYYLAWGSWPNGLSYIRRARLSAIEVK